jgi:hypothetical protein
VAFAPFFSCSVYVPSYKVVVTSIPRSNILPPPLVTYSIQFKKKILFTEEVQCYIIFLLYITANYIIIIIILCYTPFVLFQTPSVYFFHTAQPHPHHTFFVFHPLRSRPPHLSLCRLQLSIPPCAHPCPSFILYPALC